MSEPGVEQLPEKWRKRAEKAQELGHTEKAIAVLDCADELEERMDADDGPEIRTDGGVDQSGTERPDPSAEPWVGFLAQTAIARSGLSQPFGGSDWPQKSGYEIRHEIYRSTRDAIKRALHTDSDRSRGAE